MTRHPCFPQFNPTFAPHPALRVPGYPFPFNRHQEEAMIEAAFKHRLLQTLSAMAASQPVLPPQPAQPNPFLLPFMPRSFPMPHQMQKQNPAVPSASPVIKPEVKQKPSLPSNEKIETVNGGFGVKNPLARNPALQDHMLQTMGKQ